MIPILGGHSILITIPDTRKKVSNSFFGSYTDTILIFNCWRLLPLNNDAYFLEMLMHTHPLQRIVIQLNFAD